MQYDASDVPLAGAGRVIYLMGPSGAGKDSLLDAARELLLASQVRIPKRVITRSAEAVGEDAVAVSVQQYEQMADRGEFALQWRANGLAYGVPAYIDAWLAEGWHVMVNGSRAHLPVAQAKYPDLLPILLCVNPQVLRGRLLQRGREGQHEIEQRMARNQQSMTQVDDRVRRVDNSTSLDDAVRRLLMVLQEAGVRA
ncbi:MULTISPECIES: phosphonate metabolism protein/1,5-bisphosphokinase (PRPP-forming) PhnN [Pseudomonas]|uniref:Ribose 1,5-bisphosphate phosphokinase PhnN n=1 Tax=Pseudomonas putida TaxID=303 RepID=A0A9X8HJZ5_PSEPU|nr:MULTISPECIES: phosphonate metabolism protein/1,5-bisphosphokinase (PRPP-forming) PhnN [Pseudomonas]ROQ50170.1 ribose 1,5-bisphosphokinase [Pseudomonas putida]WEJ23152.1 phosphonate metabolism protein/1,5-bisphosphokinase (PRPP-forming) PhnN [Pseudomonas sp. SD17-1]